MISNFIWGRPGFDSSREGVAASSSWTNGYFKNRLNHNCKNKQCGVCSASEAFTRSRNGCVSTKQQRYSRSAHRAECNTNRCVADGAARKSLPSLEVCARSSCSSNRQAGGGATLNRSALRSSTLNRATLVDATLDWLLDGGSIPPGSTYLKTILN
jgi:hypothetical protein